MIKDNGKYHGIDENYLTYHLDSLIVPSFWIKIKKLLNPKIKNQKLNVYWDRVLTTSGAHQRALGEGIKQNFLWKDGKTFSADRNNEFMYIHFHKIKQSMDTIDFKYSDMPASFVINRKGFFSNHE